MHPEVDLAQVIDQQNATIRAMQEQMAALMARVPAPVEPDVKPGGAYPRAVYRAHKKDRPGQIDHPGQDVKVVASAAEYDDAKAEGWQAEPLPYVYPDPDAVAAAKEQAAKKAGKK